MFQNVGKTIFIIGKVLFWLFIAAAVVMFFVGGMTSGTTTAIILCLSFAVSAFMFALPICGFGKLIMDVTAIRSKMEA